MGRLAEKGRKLDMRRPNIEKVGGEGEGIPPLPCQNVVARPATSLPPPPPSPGQKTRRTAPISTSLTTTRFADEHRGAGESSFRGRRLGAGEARLPTPCPYSRYVRAYSCI